MRKAAFVLICLLILPLCALFSGCAQQAPDAGYSFEETDGGWAIASGPANALALDLPAEHRGAPVVAVKSSAFYRREVLQRVKIPSSIREIGDHAFADCSALKRVEFEKGGTCKIGEFAFEGCVSMTVLHLNKSVVSIGRGAFKTCRKLSSVKAGVELREIGEDAFMNCERLIVKAEKGCLLEEYARAHSLPQRFSESDYVLYLLLGAALFAGVGAVIAVYLTEKKRRAAKKGKRG